MNVITTEKNKAHSETANILFQVFTIAVIGVFSVLVALHAAAQIV
jgi:hypothetical protein